MEETAEAKEFQGEKGDSNDGIIDSRDDAIAFEKLAGRATLYVPSARTVSFRCLAPRRPTTNRPQDTRPLCQLRALRHLGRLGRDAHPTIER